MSTERLSSDLPPTWRPFAARLIAAARRLEEAPRCPAPVLRRLEAIPREHAPRLAGVLSLLFDSMRSPSRATRGAAAPRLLRYGGAEGSADVEVRRMPQGAELRVAVQGGDRASVLVGKRWRRVPLDATGAGRILCSPGARSALVVVHRSGREAFRTPPIPLR